MLVIFKTESDVLPVLWKFQFLSVFLYDNSENFDNHKVFEAGSEFFPVEKKEIL